MKLRFASVCDGIGAAACAWTPLGWEFVFKSEIEPFPIAVTHHHWPPVPNYGDMTKYKEWKQHDGIDLICGGTPCQAFSVAGLRKGLADPRGNLTLTYLAVVAQYRPRWVVWENVPGVLSDRTGAFGALLGGLGELGYGFAYRVLDAQYVRVESHPRAVPQRRRRVFVVGHLGDWRRAAAVLFERASVCGDSPPRREPGEGAAGTLSARTEGGGGLGTDFELGGGTVAIQERAVAEGDCGPGGKGWRDDGAAYTLEARNKTQAVAIGVNGGDVGYALRAGASHSGDKGDGGVNTTLVAHALRADGFDASEDGTGRGTPLVCAPTLTSNGDAHTGFRDEHGLVPEVAWALQERDAKGADSSTKEGHLLPVAGMAVRRLTPRECERLQGFPDEWTAVPFRGKPAADGPRYKALGNSMAVNVMRWIGERIEEVEQLKGEHE